MKGVLVCLCAMILSGCGPSAQQLAEQQAEQKARAEFHEAVAAVKVCTESTTYTEFREKRLALETCYTANQAMLTNDVTEFDRLSELMKATDILWAFKIRFPSEALLEWAAAPDGIWKPQLGDADFVDCWDAMVVITPEVEAKADFTSEQREHDSDFYANNYVRRGLTQIGEQCDAILAQSGLDMAR